MKREVKRESAKWREVVIWIFNNTLFIQTQQRQHMVLLLLLLLCCVALFTQNNEHENSIDARFVIFHFSPR